MYDPNNFQLLLKSNLDTIKIIPKFIKDQSIDGCGHISFELVTSIACVLVGSEDVFRFLPQRKTRFNSCFTSVLYAQPHLDDPVP